MFIPRWIKRCVFFQTRARASAAPRRARDNQTNSTREQRRTQRRASSVVGSSAQSYVPAMIKLMPHRRSMKHKIVLIVACVSFIISKIS